MMMDFNGNNRGYAFVTFSTKQEAKTAMKQLNNYEIRLVLILLICLNSRKTCTSTCSLYLSTKAVVETFLSI